MQTSVGHKFCVKMKWVRLSCVFPDILKGKCDSLGLTRRLLKILVLHITPLLVLSHGATARFASPSLTRARYAVGATVFGSDQRAAKIA